MKMQIFLIALQVLPSQLRAPIISIQAIIKKILIPPAFYLHETSVEKGGWNMHAAAHSMIIAFQLFLRLQVY